MNAATIAEALIRVRAALPSAEVLADEDGIHVWIHRDTDMHHSEFDADALAAHKLRCEHARTACVDPADVIALGRLVKQPSKIVKEMVVGCVRAGKAPEVHMHVKHLRHLLDQLPAVPAPALVAVPDVSLAAAADDAPPPVVQP